MIKRQVYEVAAGVVVAPGDTGGPVSGLLHQLRWNPTTGDTGANLDITLCPKAGDTGDGGIIYSIAGVNTKLATNFWEAPRQPANYGGITDNTGDSGFVPYAVAAGDRLRVKFSNSATLAGRLYLWFVD